MTIGLCKPQMRFECHVLNDLLHRSLACTMVQTAKVSIGATVFQTAPAENTMNKMWHTMYPHQIFAIASTGYAVRLYEILILLSLNLWVTFRFQK